ncbi:MAG TPA: FAD-dependent oxidoreductase [Candidatus Acidoferrum sp.]|nr:FAD-dependent oxidoreductase [Candidatus Acidoferrum sp.]
MSSPLIPSALDASTQLFPTLTAAQIDRIRPLGRLRSASSGEILFKPNDTNVPFFVVLSGHIEIVQPAVDAERPITTHQAGGFTGEMTMISGQRCLVLGRTTEPSELLELTGDGLRTLVGKDAELSEILLRAFILRRLELIRAGLGNVVLMGSRHSAKTLELREFLSRNGYPYTYVDLDTDRTSQELLDRFHVQASEVPVVICSGVHVMRSPSIQEVARCLGFNGVLDGEQVRDVIIIGAGPAGLAAAVYGASEGLDTLVIETQAPGGQAGSSSKIENYLGFPTGVSGLELAARATTQAQKFGARMVIARNVVRVNCDRRPYQVMLDGGDPLATRAIVIATGAQYNKLEVAGMEKYEGKGIYYGATYIEAQLCGGEEAAVVGGGNSAGQAAVFLSQTARKVHMLVRRNELSSTMSRYLIQRLTENPQIELHYNTEITAVEGDGALERLVWRDRTTRETSSHDVRHLFVMTGASPRTEWLRGCLALDDKGYILTGRDIENVPANDESPKWPLNRAPHMLETSLPGVFAVGDARANNVKRVASAVGEGAISIHLVHRALAEM